MAYAASMLYYLIQNSSKPIVFTGAQIPISERDTDARENLSDAFRYASDDRACGVHIVFDGKIIAGTRARKTRTKSFNAFSSIDYPDIGFIRSGKVSIYIDERTKEPVTFAENIDSSVLVIKLIPGMSSDIFEFADSHYHAVIIESFGVGGLPSKTMCTPQARSSEAYRTSDKSRNKSHNDDSGTSRRQRYVRLPRRSAHKAKIRASRGIRYDDRSRRGKNNVGAAKNFKRKRIQRTFHKTRRKRPYMKINKARIKKRFLLYFLFAFLYKIKKI